MTTPWLTYIAALVLAVLALRGIAWLLDAIPSRKRGPGLDENDGEE